MKRNLILTTVAAMSLSSALAGEVNIQAGWVLSEPGKAMLKDQTIIVKNGKVADIRAGFVTNEGAEVVDLKTRYVLPGLIDMHVHITEEQSEQAELNKVKLTAADQALDGVVFARRTLEAGFTTVRDLGGEPEAVFALRDAIAAGKVLGPRIIAAGNGISILGGHGDTNGFRPDLTFDMRAICTGADDCRRATRQQVKLGADVIKFTATGGVLSNVASGTGQHFTQEEMNAIVETAHSLGRKVAAHAHGVDGIKAALKAGVDSIEHGTYIDDEAITLFKKTGAALVPTALAGATVAARAEIPGYLSPSVATKAREVGPKMKAMLTRAYKGGVRIVFGSDSSVSHHGDNGMELAIMVDAGIPAAEALRMATIDAAKLLGLEAQIGSLEPGKAADIIAVEKDPTADITTTREVSFVMKGGDIVKAPK